MARKLASIQLISNLEPIEKADKLELASVLGWKAVVKKGLCDYENVTTNVHRYCSKAPLDPTVDGKIFPECLRHMAVIMYVVDKENPVVIE